MKPSCRIFAALGAAMIPCATSANFVFPAFPVPYLIFVFLPILPIFALLIEAAVYSRTFPAASMSAVASSVVVANAISWILGLAVTLTLPPGWETGELGMPVPNEWFPTMVAVGFVLAFALSVVIEGAVLRYAPYLLRPRAPFLLSLKANIASYIGIVLIALFISL